MSKSKRVFGLIGYPLSHSFSKKYFAEKFERENITDAVYTNFEIENINMLLEVLDNNPALKGFNVTIPYKQSIIPYLDDLDENAAQIGAVNTVKCKKNENGWFLKGYNTDYYGFKQSLEKYLKGGEKFALILGNGGAAKAVVQAIKSLGIDYRVVSRKPSEDKFVITYEDLNRAILNQTDILVNTTPLGMWPKIDLLPNIEYNHLKEGGIAYDLIYNPEETLFMETAKSHGAVTSNGLDMLILQAEKAWSIFNK